MKLKIVSLILLMSVITGCNSTPSTYIPMNYDRPTRGVAVVVDKRVLQMSTYNETFTADNTIANDSLNDLKESGTYQIISPVYEDLQKFKQAHTSAQFYFNKDYKVFVKF